MTERLTREEFDMQVEQIQVRKVAEISFGRGVVGQRYPLVSAEAEAVFGEGLRAHTREFTKPNTADCGDERRILRLADGTNDPGLLRARVAPQLFGGLGLATTKAAVAADAALVRDAKSIWQAYEKVSATLQELGEEDGGHDDCGASKSVETSVANQIDPAELLPAIFMITQPTDNSEGLWRLNAVHKKRRLQDGFYSDWDPQKHADYLVGRFPSNFSHLEIDYGDEETRGHNGSGIYLINEDNVGFAKNDHIDTTGTAAFCLTLAKMRQISRLLGGSDEERERILLAFIDDSLHVGGGIVTKDMPVFADGVAA